METQVLKIKEWLEKGNCITNIIAIQLFDCCCLPSVIFKLKKNYGLNIEKKVIKLEGRKRVTNYYLGEKLCL